MFKVDGKPFIDVISPKQREIFKAIVFRKHKRVQILASTQYGKTLTVALAVIVVACMQGVVCCVVAPSADKAKLLMRYFIYHIGDSPLFSGLLERNTKLERLKMEESKERIILRNGGGVFALSTNESNSKKKIESAMGAGADVVIMDEACLISDDTEATVFRMIAGKGKSAFYCKIGNPFYIEPPYSHFYNSDIDPNYHRIFIDYVEGIKEGRYTEAFIAEAKKKPLFDILFGCKFPDRDGIDARGYRYLITKADLEKCFIDSYEDIPIGLTGKMFIGADIGRGDDESAYVCKREGYMWIDSTNQSPDLMTQVTELQRLCKQRYFVEMLRQPDYKVVPFSIIANVDDTGVGGGVTDRGNELGLPVHGIAWGGRAQTTHRFANLKAENFWDLAMDIKDGTVKIVRNAKFYQLLDIKYKINSSEKIIIEPKEEFKARGKQSPNVADACALAYNAEIEPDIW
jgi:hypothetical protein